MRTVVSQNSIGPRGIRHVARSLHGRPLRTQSAGTALTCDAVYTRTSNRSNSSAAPRTGVLVPCDGERLLGRASATTRQVTFPSSATRFADSSPTTARPFLVGATSGRVHATPAAAASCRSSKTGASLEDPLASAMASGWLSGGGWRGGWSRNSCRMSGSQCDRCCAPAPSRWSRFSHSRSASARMRQCSVSSRRSSSPPSFIPTRGASSFSSRPTRPAA